MGNPSAPTGTEAIWLGEDAPDSLRLPRIQEGARPQHLVITLVGDYWFGRPEMLPSSALVDLAGEFGISSASTRAALSRLGRRGLVHSTKVGRRTFYGPTRRTTEVMVRVRSRIFSFGRSDPRAWDGSWLIVAFSVPEENRELRHIMRKRLRWLGFAPLYDGLWISARPVADEARAMIEECGVRNASIFSSTVIFSSSDAGPQRYPLSAWDLGQLRAVYDDFIERFDPVWNRVRTGGIGSAEALVERTAIMDAWRTFPGVDPEIPAQLLPAGWPRDRAYEIFTGVYNALGPLAETRFRQILTRSDPELATLASHYTSETVPAIFSPADRPAANS